MHRNRLQENWLAYKDKFLAPAPEGFSKAMEHAFYAGAGTVAKVLTDGINSPDSGFEDALVDLFQEIAWLTGKAEEEIRLQGLKINPPRGAGNG